MQAPPDIEVRHPHMGFFQDMVHGFQELPTWGKVVLVGAVAGAGILGYEMWKNNSSSSATGNTSSTAPDSWQANGSGGTSSGSGTTSGTTPDSGSTPSGSGLTPSVPALPPVTATPAPASQAAVSMPAPGQGVSASAYAAPAITSAATSTGLSSPARPPTSTGLADSTGTVGISTVNNVGQTVKVPANVTSSAAASGANGGPATYATTSSKPPTSAPAGTVNYVARAYTAPVVTHTSYVPPVAVALASRLGRGGAHKTYPMHLGMHPLQSATIASRRNRRAA